MNETQNNMNSKVIVLVLVAVAAAGGIWYLLTTTPTGNETVAPSAPTTNTTGIVSEQPAPAPTPTAKNPTPTPVPAKVTAPKVLGVGPVSSLFTLKLSLRCSVYTTSASPIQRSGTMYVSDGQMRANFTATTMINDGKYLYAWVNGATTGTKVLASSSAGGSAIASNGGLDPATDINYSCVSWTKDASFFVPPTSITF